MLNENFVIVGGVIAGLGTIKYIIDIMKGKVRPNKVSFFLWSLAPFIAFAAEVKQGVGIQSLNTFWVGFFPLATLIASFASKKSAWKLETFDFFCGALSLIGLLLWFVTRVGNIAIIFSIAADGLGYLPTFRKTYYYPETEYSWMWLAGSIGALLTLLTIKTWDFPHYGFPVHLLLANFIVFSLAQFRIGKRLSA